MMISNKKKKIISVNKYIGIQYARRQYLIFFVFIAKFNNLAFWPVKLNSYIV